MNPSGGDRLTHCCRDYSGKSDLFVLFSQVVVPFMVLFGTHNLSCVSRTSSGTYR